jgi:hypothetical protein
MRCGQCQFENMPGLTRCFQCGAVLTDDQQVDVHPPRMPGWKRPLRGLARRMRLTAGIGSKSPGLTSEQREARTRSWDAVKLVLGIGLSIVPGLGHLARGRFARVWWTVPIWAALVAASVYFYGTSYGYLAAGLAVGLHAWVAVWWPEEPAMRGFNRLAAAVAMFLVAAALYYTAFQEVVRSRYMWAFVTFPISAKQVETGDLLVARKKIELREVRRGMLIVAGQPTITEGRDNTIRASVLDSVVVQVIGRSGDAVELKDERFIVNGRKLDEKEYNVPAWLRPRSFSAVVPEGALFVATEYRISRGDERGPGARAVELQACIIPEGNVRGIVFMRWWPLPRRGFIGEPPTEDVNGPPASQRRS